MSLSSLENQIKTDWNWLRAFIANNQIISIVAIAALAYFAGAVLKGWPL